MKVIGLMGSTLDSAPSALAELIFFDCESSHVSLLDVIANLSNDLASLYPGLKAIDVG